MMAAGEHDTVFENPKKLHAALRRWDAKAKAQLESANSSGARAADNDSDMAGPLPFIG